MRGQEKTVVWSRRYKLNVERLASGDLDQVKQAVADLERRDRDSGLTASAASSFTSGMKGRKTARRFGAWADKVYELEHMHLLRRRRGLV